MPLFFSACVTIRHCPIETLQPAIVILETPKNNIAICASHELLSESVKSNESAINFPVDSLMKNILFTLQHFWEKTPGYENTQFFIYILPTDTLIGASNFDMAVWLDQLKIQNTYYGQEYSWTEWEAYLHVLYRAKWSIHNASETLLDEYSDYNLMEWSSGIRGGKAQAVANLPDLKDAWWDMGIVVARNFADRILPRWQTDVREIYMVNKFPELSQQAYTAMQNHGYARAFNIWENMLLSCRKHGQKRNKSHITYNMAVAWEFQNELDEAIYWAQKSANLYKITKTANYLKLLRERKQHQEKLDLQYNN
jgi:hypothetical protein